MTSPPRTGTRGSLNATVIAERDRPYRKEQEGSAAGRMARGIMPEGLPALLRWYSEEWDTEVPMALHKVEVWMGRPGEGVPPELTGGSHLGTRAHTDPFRRYLENADAECDSDGYYIRPMHAALSRLGRRWPLTARALFAVAQSGYDWRGVAARGHWAEEMFCLFLERSLQKLWVEYREQVVRLQ